MNLFTKEKQTQRDRIQTYSYQRGNEDKLGLIDTHLCVCVTLCDPMDCSPSGNSPGKNTGEDCHFLLQGSYPTQLRDRTHVYFFFFQCYSSILFIRQQENPRLEEKRVEECVGRERERERKRERARTRMHAGESPNPCLLHQQEDSLPLH